MTRRMFAVLSSTTAALGLILGGCSTSSPHQATVDQPMPEHLEMAMASSMPTFGVGDELGWLAFGDLALAPMPGEPTDVLVIVKAEPADIQSFDWVGQYLALAD
ncbi:MAG: hypothetical protein AAGA25_12375 [Planctomycetota bacterium]